jgi:DNA invertase Pin-like site-specific DNA recombinase
MSKDQILIACQELAEEGKSVTVRAVIEKTGGSSRDVSPIVKEFKENQESSIAVSDSVQVDTNTDNDRSNHTDPVAANLERIDRDAQLIAARKVIATAYYEKTKLFTIPGLQEEVNQALSDVDGYAESQDETLSPKGMLNWLKTKQPIH